MYYTIHCESHLLGENRNHVGYTRMILIHDPGPKFQKQLFSDAGVNSKYVFLMLTFDFFIVLLWSGYLLRLVKWKGSMPFFLAYYLQ